MTVCDALRAGDLGQPGWMRHGNCSTADGGASCIEDAGLSELTLDGQYHVAGGIRVSTCMGCSLGPLLYVIHFTERGIWVDGGHEVMVHRSWVGEHLYVRELGIYQLTWTFATLTTSSR